MELYYKDLISKEATLEELVDNLAIMVQGADELAASTGGSIAPAQKAEIDTRLARLKYRCKQIRKQAISSALATDKLVHEYPYSFVGFSFAAGLLLGALAGTRRRKP